MCFVDRLHVLCAHAGAVVEKTKVATQDPGTSDFDAVERINVTSQSAQSRESPVFEVVLVDDLA